VVKRWGCIHIDAEVSAGADIHDACSELVALATRLQVPVEAMFNDVHLFAVPGGDPALLEANWRKAIDSKYQHKFAHSA
jgi:hypothetical protein